MRHLATALLIVATAASAPPAEAGRPTGKNCALSAPPAEAGEDFNHGIIIRVFPRVRDIDEHYTGCQMRWLPDGDQWKVLAITQVIAGDPVRIWSPGGDSEKRFACTYRNGKVVNGPAESCAAPQVLLTKSASPGCAAKLQASPPVREAATQPKECEFE